MELNQVRKNLELHNFKTYYVSSKEEALELCKTLTINDTTFSHGGSVTLQEVGLLDYLKTKGSDYIDRAQALQQGGMNAYIQAMQAATTVDVYFSSVNAITENGYLYNVDANGNRISCIAFGPKKVILLVSINKIVPDEKSAVQRVKEIVGPANAKRLKLATPCTKSGKCEDCQHPQRICNLSVFYKKSFQPGRIHIILIQEKLGY